ncbi:MAG: hypothetical protein PHF63_10100, partial [Herbinix sp.]|nr:hypothetical protein [Herbinix sp.]
MFYLNQLEYETILYRYNLNKGGALPGRDNIKAAGCGLCCICMVVENLTMEHFSLVECRDLSEAIQANMEIGTNLKILGQKVSEMFNLKFEFTDDYKKMELCLTNGGMAVANVGGDREGYVGVFSHGGHYITVAAIDEEEICVLDPSYKEGKYEEREDKNIVKVVDKFIYCSRELLEKECENRSPA